MSKQEFIARLQKGLSGVPKDEAEGRISFYAELIDDRMEEGLSEEEAVLAVGSVEDIIAQIVAEIPFAKIAKERILPKRRLGVGEIILLILGSPIWISLCVAAFAVVLSLYISLWAVIVSLWAVFGSLVACTVGSVIACVAFVAGGSGASGVAVLAAGFVCAGLSVFMFFGCKAATKGSVVLARRFVIWVKNCFVKREVA